MIDQYEPKTNAGQGLGLVGLIIGIFSALLAIVPCVGSLAIFPGALALIFSIMGLVQASQRNGKIILPTFAVIISSIALIIAILWVFFLSNLTSNDSFGDTIKRKIEESIDGSKIEIKIEENGNEDEFEENTDTGDMENKLKQLEDKEPNDSTATPAS